MEAFLTAYPKLFIGLLVVNAIGSFVDICQAAWIARGAWHRWRMRVYEKVREELAERPQDARGRAPRKWIDSEEDG